MPAPDVSAIIVNYRSYDELDGCLSSIAHDSHASREVVIVDHDADRSRLARIESAFPATVLIPIDANEGFAAGVNRAAGRSSGRYLLLVNPDTRLSRGACAALVAWMDSHPDAGVAGPRILNADGSLQPSARRFPGVSTVLGGRSTWLTRLLPQNPFTRQNLVTRAEGAAPMKVDWVSGACAIIRRRAFEDVGGMDPGFFLYWEDADFCLRVGRRGWNTYYLPSVAVTHIGGRSSRHARTASIVAFHRSVFRYYWKHSGPLARAAVPVVAFALAIRLGWTLTEVTVRQAIAGSADPKDRRPVIRS